MVVGACFGDLIPELGAATASPYCVVPLMNEAFWNSGEPVVCATCGVPSKLVPLENLRFNGTIVTGTVVVFEPLEGLVPTIVYDHVFPSELKDDVQCFRPEAARVAAAKVWWN